MTEKLRDLTAEDREWIDARADHLFRDSERQRGGIRPATIMPQDFRDYFVAQAAWERAAFAAAPQPAPEEGLGGAQDGAMLGVIAARRAQA